MKLLFDQNLSPKLVGQLSDLFPGSDHVHNIGLDRSDDDSIWEFALANNLVIVSKDEDYNLLAVLRGSPPKVIWLTTGNCTTAHVEMLFRTHIADIQNFDVDSTSTTLVLS